MSTTIICEWQTPADFRLEKQKGNWEPFVMWKTRRECKEGTRWKLKWQNITLCSNWQGCRHLNSWDGKTAHLWASVRKEGNKFIRHTFIWPRLSLGKERNKWTDFSPICILNMSVPYPFSYLCAIWLLFHVWGTQDRNPRQDVTVLPSAVQLLNTKETHQSHTVSGRKKKNNCRFSRNVRNMSHGIGTRGILVLTSLMGTTSKIINKLKSVRAVEQSSWEVSSVPGEWWVSLHQARWTLQGDKLPNCILMLHVH